jgi:type II secretory pathway component PulF
MTTVWKIVLFAGLILLILVLVLIGILDDVGRRIDVQFFAFLVLFVVAAVLGWSIFAFFHYRYIRQEELLHVLTTAAKDNAPLAPALWAYVKDRPQSTWREFLVSILLFPVYYWSWHRWYSYDRKVEQLALILEGGAPLHLALNAVPGVASRETALAAAIGQSSGRMAPCLSQVARWQLATIWLEVVPRLLYPLIVLLIAVGLVIFQFIFIIPKFEKIFHDLKVPLPGFTQEYIAIGRWLGRYGWAFALGFLGLLALIAVTLFSSKVCWRFPVLGRLYRMHAQARVLKALAIILETGKPVPQALGMLLESGYFPEAVRQRLLAVQNGVEQGQPLPDLLYQNGLLPWALVPLLQAAGRANNLPWALNELGDSLAKRTVRLAQRLTMAIFPVSVLAIGLVVALIALGLFMPLVHALSEFPL